LLLLMIKRSKPLTAHFCKPKRSIIAFIFAIYAFFCASSSCNAGAVAQQGVACTLHRQNRPATASRGGRGWTSSAGRRGGGRPVVGVDEVWVAGAGERGVEAEDGVRSGIPEGRRRRLAARTSYPGSSRYGTDSVGLQPPRPPPLIPSVSGISRRPRHRRFRRRPLPIPLCPRSPHRQRSPIFFPNGLRGPTPCGSWSSQTSWVLHPAH
jgi:hypothetical protein